MTISCFLHCRSERNGRSNPFNNNQRRWKNVSPRVVVPQEYSYSIPLYTPEASLLTIPCSSVSVVRIQMTLTRIPFSINPFEIEIIRLVAAIPTGNGSSAIIITFFGALLDIRSPYRTADDAPGGNEALRSILSQLSLNHCIAFFNPSSNFIWG